MSTPRTTRDRVANGFEHGGVRSRARRARREKPPRRPRAAIAAKAIDGGTSSRAVPRSGRSPSTWTVAESFRGDPGIVGAGHCMGLSYGIVGGILRWRLQTTGGYAADGLGPGGRLNSSRPLLRRLRLESTKLRGGTGGSC